MMRRMDMTNRMLVFSAGTLALIVLLIGAFLLYGDSDMVFPKTPHGKFVQEPRIVTEGGERTIQWILAEACDRASYEVQDAGYERDSGMLWGGEAASCAQREDGYLCQAKPHPEMKGGGPWVIQASAYECANGDFYISNAVTVE